MTTKVGKMSFDQKEIIGRSKNGTTVFKGFYCEYPNFPGDANHDDGNKIQQVAIKRIQKTDVDNIDRSFKHEVDLMLKVGHHSNILRYIHSEMDDNFLYLATELCRGTMENFFNGKYDGLEKGIITKKEILRQVTKGLAHLHKLGIVHRDIKPTNILIFDPSSEEPRNKPQMKLADFDISKILKPQREDFTNTSVTNPAGTWGWMAPEVYEFKQFDLKVDIWALGLIFGYTLSGGKHPFGDDDTLKRIERIKQKRDMLLTKKDLSTDKENIGAFELIKSMLMADPKVRPAVMDVLKGSFLRNEIRTAQFLYLCRLFRYPITNEVINHFEELVKDETVNVNAKSKYRGWTPLHNLCRYYNQDNLPHFVELLIQNGADVNAKTEDEETPLHLLCDHYNNDNLIHVVKLLLEKGAQVNVQSDLLRDTPLSYLCLKYKKDNMLDIVKLLIANGADVNNKPSLITKLISVWRNPLSILCEHYGNDNLIDIVQFLIENGADVNAKDADGRTPLHSLCRNYKNDNLIEIVQFLIRKGANVNANNNDGETPLHLLCRYYRTDNAIKEEENLKSLVRLFLENGASINAKDKEGNTPNDELIFRKINMDPKESTNLPKSQ